MPFDEIPVDRFRKQRVNVLVFRLRIRPVQLQVLPVPNARHQLDAQQVGVMRETHCYRILLNRASRKVSALYDEALAPLGVSIAQFNLIRVIISMEPVSVTDLATFVELERSTVGRNGRVLERLGLVKMSHGSDQREALFSLTEKGHEVLKRGLPLWDSVQHGIEENLGADKARQLQRLLASL